MMTPEEIDQLNKKLEELGEEKVKSNLTTGVYGEKKKRHVETWLDKKKQSRNKTHEENELNLSKEANKIASNTNFISWIAILVAIIALIVSIFK